MMDLIAERGIAACYSGKGGVFHAPGHKMLGGNINKGKAIHLKTSDIDLRVVNLL
jgi:hypothetical protein